MTRPFFHETYDQFPKKEPGKKSTWWKYALFALAFALLFNGCVQNAKYEEDFQTPVFDTN